MGATTVFAALAMFATAAVSLASAAPSNDACALVTQDQVSAAVGASVGAGTHVTPTYVKTCTWTPSSASKDLSSVTISYWDAGSYDAGKRVMQQAQAAVTAKEGTAKMTDESASGIGDDAYYTTMGTGYTGLMLKKGNVALKIAIYGDMPADKKKAVEKTLALQALSKL